MRGKIHYFGTWDDPAAAERKWDREKQALLEGRDPDVATQGDSIGWLCNVFVESKALQRDRGELTQRAFNDYHRIAAYFGKGRLLESIRAPEFERYRDSLPDSWDPTTVNNHFRLVRVLFKYANDIERRLAECVLASCSTSERQWLAGWCTESTEDAGTIRESATCRQQTPR